ncbi:FAD dependent oxidoreductase [Boeremia exigua]|uniref:FAD dependent oxidoreductase n=1 Tax=Boeremia exigua TaxID=749465 RepID=UPI001E8CAE3C|nr:FAD dependent oxidoreductase [Boeremia exigua]KAH6644386.1 FAD dependent oxidoreductase [Boeremia exigua]
MSRSLDDRIVIIGAGVFGLSTAVSLSEQGYKDITVLDRHVPPVPDGSSVDISRIIRFDYGDPAYTLIAKEAFDSWATSTYTSNGIFQKTPLVMAANTKNLRARSWIDRCITQLADKNLPYERLDSASSTKDLFPMLSGPLIQPDLFGYCNRSAGWADAAKGVLHFRNLCIEKGISFVSGAHGTVTGFDTDAQGEIVAARTASGRKVEAEHFVLAAGAWSNKLVPMYNSTLATGQVLGYIKLTPEEMVRLKDMPIYINTETGWFVFPPHEDTALLKCAVHGWGYTRSETQEPSSPIAAPRSERVNFAPADGVRRLRDGLREVFPEIAERGFDRTAVCWYNDTPTGDFIMDYHPDHPNLFVATGGSGHAFKFLPVLGKYTAMAFTRSLPAELAQKWKFRTEYKSQKDVFAGDGSRGGPERREFTKEEKARL